MITTRLNLILHETIDNRKESSVRIERFITIGTISLGPYLLSALRNSGVSAFQGLLTYVIYVDTFGTARNVRIKADVRIFQGCPQGGVPLYWYNDTKYTMCILPHSMFCNCAKGYTVIREIFVVKNICTRQIIRD